jgi:hypothetical protein
MDVQVDGRACILADGGLDGIQARRASDSLTDGWLEGWVADKQTQAQVMDGPTQAARVDFV